jgi:hypothetical protein
MKNIVTKSVRGLILMSVLIAGSACAIASPPDTGDGNASKVKKKAARNGPTKFVPGSAETTKERNTRLMRECKGRVNAGACAGFTT